MKILIISQYYWPESFRVNDLFLGFKELGHDVSVLTGYPNYPDGQIYPEFKKNKKDYCEYQGSKIYRVPLIPRGKNSSVLLILNYISFLVTSSLFVLFKLRRKQFDVVFVFGVSPITEAFPGILYKLFKRTYIALWVLDLWPDTLSDLGKVKKDSLIYRGISRMVYFIYKRMDRVYGQSPSIVSKVNDALHGGNEALIMYNWAEDVFNKKCAPNINIQTKDDKLNILFAGNVGESQDFPSVVEAVNKCKDKPVHWYILGGGRQLQEIKELVKEKNLQGNITFLPSVPVEDVLSYFLAADVLLVSLKAGGAFSKTIPGKVQSYMASGKPILGMLDGDGKDLILKTGCGLSCGSGEVDELVRLVGEYIDMPKSKRERMGGKGLKFYNSNFKREIVIDHFFLEYKNHIENRE